MNPDLRSCKKAVKLGNPFVNANGQPAEPVDNLMDIANRVWGKSISVHKPPELVAEKQHSDSI